MPPPPSCITISSIPFSRLVTIAEFNGGTFGGEANAVWFCFTAAADGVFGVRGNVERAVDMRTRIYANDGSTILNQVTNSRPLSYPITSGDTFYVRIAKTAGGAIAADFTAEFDTRSFLTSLPAGAFFITDFNFVDVAIVFDPDGTVLGYAHLPSGEAGAMLADGGFAIANVGGLKVYDAGLTLLATIGAFSTFSPVARGNGQFWVVDSDQTVYTVSADGGTVTEVAHLADLPSSFGVSQDETILYYVLEDSPIIRRWNLITDTAMADLYTAADFDNAGDGDVMGLTVNFTPNGELLVLTDGTIVTWWQDGVSHETNFLHISAAGALLNRIITTGFLVDHPQPAVEGPNYIFAWMQDYGQVTAEIGLLNLTTGLFESPILTAEFGSLRNGNPSDPLYNQAMFGPETSCIMLRTAAFSSGSPSPGSPSGGSPGSPSPGEFGIIGPLAWVEWPRLIAGENVSGDEPVTPPTPVTPTPPSPPPVPPPGPTSPVGSPPPEILGTYGPQTESMPGGATVIPAGADIQAYIDANPAGTVFWLLAGYYRLVASLIPKNNNQFWGEFGATITGARVLTNWFFDGLNYYVSNQTQNAGGGGTCLPGYSRCGHPEDVFYDQIALRHAETLSQLTSGRFFFDYDAKRIYIRDNPAGHTVETSVTTLAISGAATGVMWRNILVEKFAAPLQSAAITPGGSGWTAYRMEVRHVHGIGLRIAPGMTVQRCRLDNCGQMGIGGTGAGAVVTENEWDHNGAYSGVDWGWEGGGSKFTATNGLTLTSNWVHHNTGPGMWCDIDNINVLYDGNLVEDNTAYGIFHEISYAAIIRNNTCRRNGGNSWAVSLNNPYATYCGIMVAGSPDVEVYGNTLDDNQGGIWAMQQARGSGTYGPHEIENLYVHDNLVRGTVGPHAGLFQDIGDTTYFTARNNRFEDNDYQGACGSAKWLWQNGSRTFTEWQAYGHDDMGSCAA